VAVKKATTTEDFTEDQKPDEVPAEDPKETETATDEVAVSASDDGSDYSAAEPEPELPKAPKGYTHLVGPSGAVSTVPDSILQDLLDSGYKKK